jgi:hypothetical protein
VIDGKQILAKNRDRTYKPQIDIIHEIVNGIEIVYYRDRQTGWIEGMNENGLGVINSTLSISDSKQPNKIKSKALKRKKNIIYKILTDKNSCKEFYDIIKSADENYILEGNTIIFCNDKILHVENNRNNNVKIEDINKTTVFTNHGIITNEGYIHGIKGLSSFLRKKIVETELETNKISSIDELVKAMNKNYTNIDPRLHPYRDCGFTLKMVNGLENKPNISTTGQIVLNMTDKELIYYKDHPHSKGVVYVNKLPTNYIPKIKITLKETQKNLKPEKIFTQKYLKQLYRCFNIDSNKHNITKRNLINKNRTKTCKNVKLEIAAN